MLSTRGEATLSSFSWLELINMVSIFVAGIVSALSFTNIDMISNNQLQPICRKENRINWP